MSSLIKQFVTSDLFSNARQIELESIFIAHFLGYNHKIVWDESEEMPTHYFWFYLRIPSEDDFQEVVVRIFHEAEIVSYTTILSVPFLEFPRKEKKQRIRIYAERRFWNDHQLDTTQFSIGDIVYIREFEDLYGQQDYIVIDGKEFYPKPSKGIFTLPIRFKQYKTPGTVVYYNGEPNVKQVIFGLIKSNQIVTIKHE